MVSHGAVAHKRFAARHPFETAAFVTTSHVNIDDRELLRRMADGHEVAAGTLYDRYGAPLFGFVFRLVGEQADAEEVVMDTFLQAWRSAAGFDGERGSVQAWLTMMARSRALDLLRVRGRRERMITTSALSDGDGAGVDHATHGIPGESIEQEEQRRAIATALALLSAPQRTVIELAFFEGLSQSEIAARLREPLGTIKTRARLGMQKLRDALRPLHLE